MNDLDLRTALHRDAELVGSPSPDLLDQLAQRRQDQWRRRAGVCTAVLGMVVIAAGIPVGQSLLHRSDGGPADETTVVPTPPVAPGISPIPTPTPAPATVEAPAPGVPPVVDVAPAPSVPPGADVAPHCPDIAVLDAALPADTSTKQFEIVDGDGWVCSGSWAAAGYTERTLRDGEWWGDGQAALFRYVDGEWTFLPRNDHCGDAGIPAEVWERGCNVD
jgi:hypothetical protein